MMPEQVMQRLVGVDLTKGELLPKELDDRQALTFREGLWQTKGGDAIAYLQDADDTLFRVEVRQVSP